MSSGSESGWTSYLDQSSFSETQYQRYGGLIDEDYTIKAAEQEFNEEEEDLSMVSDASSGPPHFNEEDDCFGRNMGFPPSSLAIESAKKSDNKKKKKIKKNGGLQQHSYLDDTASSPVLSFNNKKSLTRPDDQVSMQHVLSLSQGFSGTHFKGKSAFQKHFNWLQSISKKPTSKEPGDS